MRKVLEMQDSLLSASAISVLCVLARGQMRSLKSATVWPHGFALSPLPLCADRCTPTRPHLCIWDSPTTVPMDHEDEDVQCELHPLCTVLQYQPSKFCAPGGAAREGLRLLLSPCHGHNSLVMAGLQHSCHFWAGFV